MSLLCVDAASVRDLKVFLERAERLGASSVRLTARGATLIVTVPVLVPSGLASTTPLIVAMRVSEIVADGDADKVVAIRSILERIARLADDSAGPIEWPPAELFEAWAGISAPKSGWHVVADVELDYLKSSAEATLGALLEVSTTQPEQVLAAALSAVDERMGIPVGLAAAAQSLGFLVGEQDARLSRNGRWCRLSTPFGHVLSR